MTALTINYFLANDDVDVPEGGIASQLLGTESSSNIEQVLCPKGSGDHSITITKFFHGQDVHRWLITDIVHPSNSEVNIFLSPRILTKKEVFLTKTRKSHPSIIKKIQKGTLVEVEFGYVQQVKRSDGEIRTNKRYPDMLHQGEMHKRRLSIVVGVKGMLVRVVPITSVEEQNLNDKSIFEVSNQSLQELVHYNDPSKCSFAICSSMQTVAMSRILPPLSKQTGKPKPYRDSRYPHKLVVGDIKSLEAALSVSVDCGDYQSVKNERNQYRLEVQQMQDRLGHLERDNELLSADNTRLSPFEKRFEALMEIMIDWKMRISPPSESIDSIKESIEREIEKYREILE
ncbi:hypothetical protein AYI84_19425 [Shewanella algae]|uniref:hypothetical protein n=1 Tax=Shewanella algae TaxID=38313 RepID=UPI001183D163|nr:hypothetical protein [Shewanella algae]TVK98905.1 hypothetical protein AYI84_19425 [Shewanella algae]